MSTRWYPIYQRGNPQLRVFLPNFWMKLIKPKKETPQNVVNFACSMEMTDHDVKNYLEKIYKIPVVDVKLLIAGGRFKKAVGANYIVKDDDTKIAIITLPIQEKFEFPNLFPEEKDDQMEKSKEQIEALKQEWQKSISHVKQRPGIPSWFGL